MRASPTALLLLLLALAGPAIAKPADYRLDPVHSRVLFLVDHAGFSRAIGTFSGATGQLHFDPEDWTGARLELTLPLASLDLGDAKWRETVLGKRFLDTDDHAQAHFVSTRVEPGDDATARVYGDLTLRGQTREIRLDVRLNALKRHPLTFRRTAGFSATASLRRSDFGIDAWPNVVGDQVELIIEAEAVRGGAGPEAPNAPDQETDDADPE